VKLLQKKASTANLSDAFSGLDRCGGPPTLVHLAKRCLSPDPENRSSDASEMVTAITDYLDSGQLRAEQELVRFFDLSMDLFCIANTSGYFYRLNENFQRVLGYTAAELTSCQFVDFVHPDDQGKTLVEIEKLARGEPALQFINRYRHKDGHYVWLEWMARSVPEEASVYAVARDVTERIAASEARQKLEAEHHMLGRLVDATKDAIICKDPSGFIRSWNASAAELYGYSADEVIGKHISILLRPEQLREELEVAREVRRRGSIPPFQTVRVGKDGTTIDVSISMSLLFDAQGSIISISRRHSNQHEA
jgi:PAS domain S-box-containing protein